MRLLPSLAGAVLIGLGSAAHAQILSVYGTFSPTNVSSVQTGTVLTGATYTQQYASNFTPNFGGGVTFGALPIGPVRIGFDLRGSTKSGTVGSDLAMAGIKVGIKLPLLAFKPYGQLSGGYLATRTFNLSTGVAPGTTFENKYAAYEVLGGVDYGFLPFIDLRLVEIGVGKGYDTGISFGNVANGGKNATLVTVNTGVVVHF